MINRANAYELLAPPLLSRRSRRRSPIRFRFRARLRIRLRGDRTVMKAPSGTDTDTTTNRARNRKRARVRRRHGHACERRRWVLNASSGCAQASSRSVDGSGQQKEQAHEHAGPLPSTLREILPDLRVAAVALRIESHRRPSPRARHKPGSLRCCSAESGSGRPPRLSRKRPTELLPHGSPEARTPEARGVDDKAAIRRASARPWWWCAVPCGRLGDRSDLELEARVDRVEQSRLPAPDGRNRVYPLQAPLDPAEPIRSAPTRGAPGTRLLVDGKPRIDELGPLVDLVDDDDRLHPASAGTRKRSSGRLGPGCRARTQHAWSTLAATSWGDRPRRRSGRCS